MQISWNGLVNHGNTCFINAVVQCINSVPVLAERLASIRIEDVKHRSSADGRFITSLIELLKSMERGSSQAITKNCKQLVDHFYLSGLQFTRNQEQDAHEFLVFCLEKIDLCILPGNFNLNGTFRLQTRDEINCMINDTHVWTRPLRNDLFLSLIPFRGKLVNSIQEYFDLELLTERHNKVFCSSCSANVPAFKDSVITSIGDVLIIQLLRYQRGSQGFTKTNDIVDIPSELLLSHLMFNNDHSCEFQLNAICIHAGPTMTSGHYTALCKGRFDSKWRIISDNNLESEFDSTELPALWMNLGEHAETPYLLFYSKSPTASHIARNLSMNSLSFHDGLAQHALARDDSMNTICSVMTFEDSESVSSFITSGAGITDNESLSSIITDSTDISVQLNTTYAPRKQKKQSHRTRSLIKKEYARVLRTNTSYRLIEKQRDVTTKAAIREKQITMKFEQNQNTERRRVRRQNTNLRAVEQLRDCEARRNRREDQIVRANEQLTNTMARIIRRVDPEFRENEQFRDTQARYQQRNDIGSLIARYETAIREGPTNICVTCGGLFYKRSMCLFNSVNEHSDGVFWARFKCDDERYRVCLTCNGYVRKGKLPPLALKNGLDFNPVDPRLEDLTELEERLVCPRIPFTRIRTLGWDAQKGMRGNVVNVPSNTDDVLRSLPREFNQTSTIQLKFMRRMNYNHAYNEDYIRPFVVMTAFNYLITMPLFKADNVTCSRQWVVNHTRANDSRNRTEVYVVDEGDIEEITQSSSEINTEAYTERHTIDSESVLQTEQQTVHQIEQLADENQQSYVEDHQTGFHFIGDVDNCEETMIESDNIIDRIIKVSIAPGEGNAPIPVTVDKNAEYLSFVKIYGGDLPKYPTKLSYASICKSEFRRYDRRCATNIGKIFFSYKKLVAQKVRAAIETCIRKTSVPYEITVDEVLNSHLIEAYVANGQAAHFLRAIRSSPHFWELKKIEINSMIKQLGCPTFFVTFSPAEVDWIELLIILVKTSQNRTISNEQATQIPRQKRNELISQDPVTTSRFFENRMIALLNFTFSKNSVFQQHPVKDYYWRVDFQYRGSPHVHMLTWNENAPLLNGNNEDEDNRRNCEEFIDKYVTCHRPSNNRVECSHHPELYSVRVSFQEHVHKHNCKKIDEHQNVLCRYGFPRALLDKTLILDALSSDHPKKRRSYSNYLIVRDQLIIAHENYTKHKKNTSVQEFLTATNLTYDKYIMALRSSIDKTTVFLKRTCSELMLNQYNKSIFVRHRGNMDIQFITDPYGCAAYVSAYMLKSNAVMSQILKKANEELDSGNLTIKQKLTKLADKFHNCSEISAQEAVYTLLSMPVSHSSRDSIFINTYPSKERTLVFKQLKQLSTMKRDSTDVFKKNLIDHYKNRPQVANEMCLAEFASMFDFVTVEKYTNRENPECRVPRFTEEADDLDEDLYEPQMQMHLDDDRSGSESQSFRGRLQENNSDNYLKLDQAIGFMKKRKQAKIIRYKRYHKSREQYDYFRVELMLFFPWRDDVKEIEVDNTFDAFEKHKDVLARNKALFESVLVEQYEAAQAQIELEIREHHEELQEEADDWISANNALINDQFGENEAYEDEYGYHARIDPAHICSKTNSTNDKIIVPCRLPNDQYGSLMSSMNRGQHYYLMNFMRCIRRKQLFQHFVSGFGGTGKSQLLKAIYQWTSRLLNPNDKEHVQTVVLSAFTGSAAFGIRGMTLHSLFHLPVHTKQMGKLVGASLNAVRKDFEHVSLIVVDEISMVGKRMFSQINERLQQIKNDSPLPFGGIPIIVMGDFNQLRPLQDIFIFQRSRLNGYNKLVSNTNPLWEPFKIHTLTQVMRQLDIDFCSALNQLGDHGVIGLNPQQVEMFNSRIIANMSMKPPEASALFHSNNEVDAYNQKKLSENDEPGIHNAAIVMAIGPDKDCAVAQSQIKRIKKTKRENMKSLADMPHSIHLKCGIKYMFVNNQNQQDGICNGTIGTLMKIVPTQNLTEEKTLVKRVWLSFEDPDVGKLTCATRERNRLARKDSVNDATWMPIKPFTFPVKILEAHKESFRIERKQFAFREAEAVTIHKAQGATLQSVFVGLSSTLDRSLTYVALSRVCSLGGLYMYGRHSIESEHIKKMTAEERQAEVIDNCRKSPVQQEMLRMRTKCPIDNAFLVLDPNRIEGALSVMFHNTRGYMLHQSKIEKDWGYKLTDLLLFVETHMNMANRNDVFLPGYSLLNLTGSLNQSSSNGQLCFIKDEKKRNVSFVRHNANALDMYDSNMVVELSMIKFCNEPDHETPLNTIFICSVYKHPKVKSEHMFAQLDMFLESCFLGRSVKPFDLYKIYVLGDFNLDYEKSAAERKRFRDEYGLNTMPLEFPTHEKGGKIDWCLTNDNNNRIWQSTETLQQYESWFSDHTPLWLNIDSL